MLVGILGVALCFAGGTGLSAAEAPVLQEILESGQVRVGMSGDQPPFNFKDRSGNFAGLDVDLTLLLASAIDVELSIVEKPFPELLDALESGEVDLVVSGMTITAERSVNVTFVGPYALSGKSLLTKSRLLAGAQEAGDINEEGITLVALENSTSQSFVERRIPLAKLSTTSNYDAAIRMVLEGKVDAMIADMPICQLATLQHPGEDLFTSMQPLNIEPIGIAIAPGDPQLKSLLENYIQGMSDMGLIELLRARWFEDDSWLAELP